MTFAKMLTVIAPIFLALCTGAPGARHSGKMVGKLKDQAGNVIPQAAATLTNKARGVKQTTQADNQGTFVFPVVPVGADELLVSTESFRPYKKSDIAIDLGSALQLEVELEPAE